MPRGIEALVVVGGNGSQTGAASLAREGFAAVGVPSTIDNDLHGTDVSIGADTAINVTLEAIDRLRTTASSHQRAFEVETMGRDCGYIALMAGIAGGAEVIAIPEREVEAAEVAERLRAAYRRGKTHALVVCLWASPEAIWEHVRGHNHRPLLNEPDPLARIRELLAAREPYYRQADVLWNWPKLPDDIRALAKRGHLDTDWSAGRTRNLEPGSRAYLVRLGVPPKGLFGAGTVMTAPVERRHWRKDKAAAGAKTGYVMLRLDALFEMPIVTFDDLALPPFAGFRWGIRQCGVRVPGPLAESLDALWQSRCAAATAAIAAKRTRRPR